MGILKKIDYSIDRFASFLLVLCVLAVLFCSSSAIILRWFHINLYWVDPFVRHTVFLSAFLGGVVATGRSNHISIDLISKLLELKQKEHARIIIHRIVLISSALIMLWLFKASIGFMQSEMEFSKVEFWGIGSGFLVGIIPFGVTLIGIRFFVLFLLSFDKDAPALHGVGVVK
ncbi:MAG: TRAP transporter small permease subunit [Rhizobacter sp.]|nr:TRAP transporter small permease subunit [Bacteriovorax sp.]